jgi:hypothetical protein
MKEVAQGRRNESAKIGVHYGDRHSKIPIKMFNIVKSPCGPF